MRLDVLPFAELTPFQLYNILHLRNIVFVKEQDCVYVDTDFVDQSAYHFMVTDDEGKLLAYTRLIPEGVSYPKFLSIGRVVNDPSTRGQGIGKKLMQLSIEKIGTLFGKEYPIQIGAQRYLERFYSELGFKQTGEPYLEDGIPHIHMIRSWE